MKQKQDHQKVINNQATPLSSTTSGCTDCAEPVLFAFQDKHHQFTISLTNILDCLEFAEQQGVIPPIPKNWWHKVKAY